MFTQSHTARKRQKRDLNLGFPVLTTWSKSEGWSLAGLGVKGSFLQSVLRLGTHSRLHPPLASSK